jgi:hypothetical protein
VSSHLVVRDKMSDNNYVLVHQPKYGKVRQRVKGHIDKLPLYFFPNREKLPFHLQWKLTGLLDSLL